MCERCKKYQVTSAAVLAGALADFAHRMNTPEAGDLAAEMAVGVGRGYDMLEWDAAEGTENPEQHRRAEAEGARLVSEAVSKFDSMALSDMETLCCYIEASLMTMKTAARKVLFRRYEAGDRNMSSHHLRQIEQALDCPVIPRDPNGFPIMAPVDYVS